MLQVITKGTDRRFYVYVVVGAIWTVDIGLDSSVVELLTRVAGVPGSNPGPAICFQYVYAHSSFPTTDGAVAFLVQAI